MKRSKRILVIGGGFSGILAIKCLKEDGYEPICYEKTSSPGGTWFYREDSPQGIPSIMPSTVINHSKEMGAITNFVPDKEYPNYMRHHELFKYFTQIGERFDCFRHILYNREVIKVQQSVDYNETGRWDVTVKNTETNMMVEETFDAVFVGTGQFTYPKMGHYPGMEKFQGTIMHTHDLKRVETFRDKKVLVIGMGCSGIDAAVEISNVASQVYISTRTGAWIMPRLGPYGLPFDYALLRKLQSVFQNTLGHKFCSWYLEKFYLTGNLNHKLYNLHPQYSVMSKEPTTNDFLPAKIMSGSILIHQDVECFTERGVIFENASNFIEVDAVVMATGYTWKFPFLSEDIIRKNDRINLYKCVYPAQLKHPSLAIIGFILPFGPGIPLGEMQCRWAVQVLSGKRSLPNEKTMMADVNKRHNLNCQRYAPSDRMTVRVDYIAYMDELANEIGCKPNIWKLMLADYKLFDALVWGPSLPYQYRLEGPHKWEGARKAILTSHERVKFPLSGGCQKKAKSFFFKRLIKAVIIVLIISFLCKRINGIVISNLIGLIFAYITTWKKFYPKLFFCLLILPFFIRWDGFISCYLITMLVPVLLALI